MKRFLTSLTIVSSLAIVSTAMGKPAARMGNHGPSRGASTEERFNELDANHDGKISRNEAQTARMARFRVMDKNNDGAVTQDEAAAARSEQQDRRLTERFAAEDTNKDKRISKTETKMSQSRFERADKNADGYLSLEELRQARPGPKSNRKGETPFFRMDANHDGKVTRQEVEASPLRLFERRDADGDGSITKDEFRSGQHRANSADRRRGDHRSPPPKARSGERKQTNRPN